LFVAAKNKSKVAKEYLGLSCANQPSQKNNNKDVISSYDIADFLGWKLNKVWQSLKRLNLVSEGVIEKEAVESLPSTFFYKTLSILILMKPLRLLKSI
jgi:hypothetical protein